MTRQRYDVDTLYNSFKGLASMRKGHSAYENDHDYWDDGHCNWGGRHRLREDCQTIARGMAKFESLNAEDINNELERCTSQSEYNSKKQDCVRKANEVSNELQIRTGASSSMFGICCIWADEAMNYHVESKLKECRRELEDLKRQLGEKSYQTIQELRELKLEEEKLRNSIEENKRKAQREKDPSVKRKLLLLIEEDGKKLEANLKRQQTIRKNEIKFDPKQHVDDLIDRMKRAIGKIRDGDGGSGGNPNLPNKPGSDPDNPFGDNNGGGGDKDKKDRTSRGKKEEKKEKDNSQMLLIVIAVIVLFFLMSQKDNSSRRRDYDEFDYY